MKNFKVLLSVILALILLCGCTGTPATTTTDETTEETTAAEITTNAETKEETTEETKGVVTETEPTETTDTEEETTTVTETTTEENTTAEETTTPEETTTEETTTAAETKPPVTTAETTKEETKPPVTTAPETKPPVTTAPETTAPETEDPYGIIDEELPDVELLVPERSDVVSYDFALDMLELCKDGNRDNTAMRLNQNGFDVLFTKYYDKPSTDRSHTSAYTVGVGKYNEKRAYIIVIRGTSGGEWYSNFDFAPSHSNDTQYAENFLAAAQDIYLSVKDLFDKDKDAYIFVCGHSRGAATANLLGVLLDEAYGTENIYVYTYATPGTVRGEAAKKEYKNIFNFINTHDVVVYVPLEEHGFSRAGTDIKSYITPTQTSLIKSMKDLSKIAPTIKSYYEDKHSLTQAGLSNDGMTVYEVMQYLCTLLATGSSDMSKLDSIKKESDLYPFVSTIKSFATNTLMLLQPVMEHEPSMYQMIIEDLQKKASA